MKRFKKIAIIGVGLMGGSLARALRRFCPGITVWGWARSKKSYLRIKKAKVVHRLSTDLAAVLKNADAVVLGLPVGIIISTLKTITPYLKKGAVVFDLGSSKKEIAAAAKRHLPAAVRFVGCHPLCGSEKSGVEYSRGDLYQGALCIITASAHTAAARSVEQLFRAFGARVAYMSPDHHDKVLSTVSHLPHLISFSLTELVPRAWKVFAANSFKDLTRISNSPPELWADIFISNKGNILRDINRFIGILKCYQKKDKKTLIDLIKAVNAKQKLMG